MDICLDDGRVLDAMASAARMAGAHVLSQVRYHFGHNSPPGFTCMCLLDESHCSAHCYADTHQIAMDIFTCGSTSPYRVLELIREQIDLGTVTVKEIPRFLDDTRLEPSSPIAVSRPDQDLTRQTECAL